MELLVLSIKKFKLTVISILHSLFFYLIYTYAKDRIFLPQISRWRVISFVWKDGRTFSLFIYPICEYSAISALYKILATDGVNGTKYD